MLTVLIIEPDASTRGQYCKWLRAEGFVTHGESTAVALRPEIRIDLVVSEAGLPGLTLPELLAALKELVPINRIVLTAAVPSIQSAVYAVRQNVANYLPKPLACPELVAAVKCAYERSVAETAPLMAHAAGRWADAVVRAIRVPSDPSTLREWGRAVGAAPGTLRNWCRTARLPARESLYFVRLLRAVIFHHQLDVDPEQLLNVADRRTLQKLVKLGRNDGPNSESLPTTVDDFLEVQRWIRDPVALREIRSRLAAMKATTTASSTGAGIRQ